MNPQDPDGSCSQQSLSDIDGILAGLESVQTTIMWVNKSFKFNIGSAQILVVENLLFFMMRQGLDMVLQFAYKFSSCTRELLKQMCKCPFLYFTNSKGSY